MSRRAMLAVAILVLWVGGLAVLMQRELFRPDEDRLMQGALRVNPGVMYYAVLHEGAHVGYASSTVDTLTDTLRVTDYLVADLPVGKTTQRSEARIEVLLSRGMRLRSFTAAINAGPIQTSTAGEMEGDSILQVISRAEPSSPPDTQRIALDEPVLLPTVVPLALALAHDPAVGRRVEMSVFDPVSLTPRRAALRLTAETTFVIPDSAVLDARSRRWTGAIPIRTRAWRIESDDPSQVTGWVDEQGRMTRAFHLDALTLQRMPHEMAFENWRADVRERPAALPPPAAPAAPSRSRPAAPR